MESDHTPESPVYYSNVGPSRSSSLRNRFSNASLISLASIRTLLPQYSAVDNSLDASDIGPRPPSWSSQTTSSGQRFQNDHAIEPPSYASESTSVEGEFRYSFPIRPKSPWATLHLRTRNAEPGNFTPLQTQPRVPRLWSCDPIRGTLELNLDSPQTIQKISITLNGSVVLAATSEGSLQFLSSEVTLWDKSMGNPSHSGANTSQKADGRFAAGKYIFPFSFPFPTHANAIKEEITTNPSSISPFPTIAVGSIGNSPLASTFPLNDYTNPEMQKRPLSSSGLPSPTDAEAIVSLPSSPTSPTHFSLACPLPQSFMEKSVNSNVTYDLLLRIDHGRFRGSSKIKTNVVYFPASRTHPLPSRRREAYESGGLLPCPMDDPEGWLSWPTLTVYGVVNSDTKPRHTKAECVLHLARPLSYARGSVIPCFLTISGEDGEVVQMLSNQRAPMLRLLRCIQHPIVGEHAKPTSEQTPNTGMFGTGVFSVVISVSTGELTSIIHEVGRAVWWVPSKSVVQRPNVRHLEGEIHLSESLPPTCDFRLFRVQYFVELLPFRADSFVPEVHPSSRGVSNQKDAVLASNPVEITTLYGEDEPVPIVYSEPPKTTIMRRLNTGRKWGRIAEEDE